MTRSSEKKFNVSLFSGGGFGDLGMHANDVKTIVFCEKIKERADLIQSNFPDSKVSNQDIYDAKTDIIRFTNDKLKEIKTKDCIQ